MIDFARLCKPVSCFPGFAHLASACATHFYLRPHRLDFSFHIYTYKYARTHSSLFIRFGLRARTAIRNIYIYRIKRSSLRLVFLFSIVKKVSFACFYVFLLISGAWGRHSICFFADSVAVKRVKNEGVWPHRLKPHACVSPKVS